MKGLITTIAFALLIPFRLHSGLRTGSCSQPRRCSACHFESDHFAGYSDRSAAQASLCGNDSHAGAGLVGGRRCSNLLPG